MNTKNDPQEQHRQCPYGSIEALFILRGEPLPSRINDRTPDQFFVAPKANNGERPADRPVVTGVPIVPSNDSRDNVDTNITFTVGEPEESDWLIFVRDSNVPLVCNKGTHNIAAVWDACMLVEGA